MIYHISNKEISSINLCRIDNQTFKILSFDKLTIIMTGSDYTIVNNKLALTFNKLLSAEIEIKPIKIIRKATNEEWNGFSELIIKEHIDPEKIKVIEKVTRNVWHYHHHLFVSEGIKNMLELEFEGELEFSLGFSHFG